MYTLYMIKKGNIMFKTIQNNHINGTSEVTFELKKHNVETPSEWWAILQVSTNGVSHQNEHGGFPCRNTGKPAHIKRCWKEL